MSTSMIQRHVARSSAATTLLLAAVAGAMAACGALDVSDPTVIEEGELNNAAGARLLRGDALEKFYVAFGEAASEGALMSDEFFSDPPAFYVQTGTQWEERLYDQRESRSATYGNPTAFEYWLDARRAASVAIPKLRAYATDAETGEIYVLRGFGALRLAEDICPGFPLHDVVDLQPVYGTPLTTDQAFERAVADLDTALSLATDSARILNFAAVAKARALLGLGRFADAATAVASVPTDFTVNALYSPGTAPNPLLPVKFNELSRSVANQDGGTGLDFVAATDPRVQTTAAGTAVDGVTTMYGAAKYPSEDAPIVAASGIEARLIEAEAALNASQGTWLTILNELRATQVVPALPPLADPGSTAARIDLLFRERAFWLFATGHRLGDLRRLISRYGRATEVVFPTGVYRLGGVYSVAASVPFNPTREAAFNPAVTGCTES